jgi:3-oxoacyl-[acyl-carrier-protein] synthase II
MAEALDAARSRGARVYAEVAGFGAGCSSWPPYVSEDERPTTTSMSGDGLELAIRRALKDARLEPGAIDAIVPQASGTELEDRAELGALRAVFGDRLGSIPAVTLTPNVGNACAGAGAMAAAVGVKVIAEQRLPARLNGPGAAWAGASPGGPASIGAVLVCSGSLGGQNAAAVFTRVKA